MTFIKLAWNSENTKEITVKKNYQIVNYLQRNARILLAIFALSLTHLASANEEHAANWGPKVGTNAPMLEAEDQAGKTQTLSSLKGPKGLLVVFNRSVDW